MSTVTVTEEFAEQYREYVEFRKDLAEQERAVLASYREVATHAPEGLGVPCLAAVLRGEVRIGKGATDAMLRHLGGAIVSFDEFRAALEAKSSVRAVIGACESGCPTVLVRALGLLFAEEHPRIIEFPSVEPLLSECDDGDDGSRDDEFPPPGYGGDE